MFTKSLPLPSPISSPAIRRKWEALVVITSSKKANLFAERKSRVRLPDYVDGRCKDFPIREFLAHPSGVESLLNKRTLQSFEPVGSHTYRCTLNKIQLLKFDAVPILELRVTPTSEDCTVEMLSCKFTGSKSVEQQNNLFSAFMVNHITWEEDGLEPCLQVDVILKITLEQILGVRRRRVIAQILTLLLTRAESNALSGMSMSCDVGIGTVCTKPFSLLPVSVVEKPGNLVMQGLIDRLVPLLTEQLLKDYDAWVEAQYKLASQTKVSVMQPSDMRS